MLDSPTFGPDPDYQEHALDPLSLGEGVACFLAREPGDTPAVVFFRHAFSGMAAAFALDERAEIRVAQAIAIQRAARRRALDEGFLPVVA